MVWPHCQQRTTGPLYHPSPQWGGEENGKKKAEFLGWNEDKFNRIAKELNNNNSNTDKKNIQNKGIHRATLSLPNAQQLPSHGSPPSWPALPLSTQHDSTWY